MKDGLLLLVADVISCYKLDLPSPLNDPHARVAPPMKILAVPPSSLMYSKIFLRLEPLGIELIAAAARRAGHDVRLIDLQVEPAGELSSGCSASGGPTRSPSLAITWPTCPR